MITEIAVLNIKKNESRLFEAAFRKAQAIIGTTDGYVHHELLKCIEEGDKYILIVRWKTLEDHTEGFRKGDAYNDWKKMLHHFYDPFPIVEHYKKIY